MTTTTKTTIDNGELISLSDSITGQASFKVGQDWLNGSIATDEAILKIMSFQSDSKNWQELEYAIQGVAFTAYQMFGDETNPAFKRWSDSRTKSGGKIQLNMWIDTQMSRLRTSMDRASKALGLPQKVSFKLDKKVFSVEVVKAKPATGAAKGRKHAESGKSGAKPVTTDTVGKFENAEKFSDGTQTNKDMKRLLSLQLDAKGEISITKIYHLLNSQLGAVGLELASMKSIRVNKDKMDEFKRQKAIKEGLAKKAE